MSSGPDDDARVIGEHLRVHEAGHAVVGHSSGLVIDEVIAKSSGHVSAVPSAELCEPARTPALVAYYAAGKIAEEVILGAARADHGERDTEEIDDMRRALPERGDDIERAITAAKEVVEANRRVIEGLAKRLQSSPPTVRGDDLAKFLDRVEPLPQCGSASS